MRTWSAAFAFAAHGSPDSASLPRLDVVAASGSAAADDLVCAIAHRPLLCSACTNRLLRSWVISRALALLQPPLGSPVSQPSAQTDASGALTSRAKCPAADPGRSLSCLISGCSRTAWRP